MVILLAACGLIVGAVAVIAWSMMPYVPALDDPFEDESKRRPTTASSADAGPTNLHQAMLARSRSERVVSPLIQKIQTTAKRMTPESRIDALYAKAVSAGLQNSWTRPKLVMFKAVGLVIGLFLAVMAWKITGGGGFGLLMSGAAAVIGYMGLDMQLNAKSKRRQTEISSALPDVIDQISISVSAGLGFEAAIARTADSTTNSLTEELKRMMNDIRLGSSRANAFAALSERAQVDDLSNFVRSISQAEKTGVSISKVLQVQADEQRERRRQRAEERAMKMPVFLIFPLVTCILPPLFIVLLGPAVLEIMETGFG